MQPKPYNLNLGHGGHAEAETIIFFQLETPSILISDVAAPEFGCILSLRRANHEHQNPDILTTMTELPFRLFPLRRRYRNLATTR
jgi:hypothetical protein